MCNTFNRKKETYKQPGKGKRGREGGLKDGKKKLTNYSPFEPYNLHHAEKRRTRPCLGEKDPLTRRFKDKKENCRFPGSKVRSRNIN